MQQCAIVLGLALGLSSCGRDSPSADAVGHPHVFSGGDGRKPAKPLTPGGLHVFSAQRFVAVVDADNDKLTVVDTQDFRPRGSVRFPENSWPTSSIISGSGQLQVLLRGSGQLATVNVNTLELRSSRKVCNEPRGLTYDAALKRTLVACAGGELVSLFDDSSTRSVQTGIRDLRDVVTAAGKIWVSTFRSAELIEVLSSQTSDELGRRFKTPVVNVPLSANRNTMVGRVAWKTFATESGKVVMIHQRETAGELTNGGQTRMVNAYGGSKDCPTPAVVSSVSVFGGDGVESSFEVPGSLPVDAAVSGKMLTVAGASSGSVVDVPLTDSTPGTQGCVAPLNTGENERPVIAVAYGLAGMKIVQRLNPSTVEFLSPDGTVLSTLALDEAPVSRDGQLLFHRATPSGLSCASCHPEAGEDGHVWTVSGKARRTQTLSGGLSATAPFHWQGEFRTIERLLQDTMVTRMGDGLPPVYAQQQLMRFLDAVASPRSSDSENAAELKAGEAVFAKAGCADCHAGPRLGSNESSSVGTGGLFQVPSLQSLGFRAPFMHTGCAQTLAQRFDPACGGAQHGGYDLTDSDRGLLLKYLDSL
jgi:hypothetical protein